AFGPRGEVWYGTVGNGWGLSTDGGKTWKNWEFRELGPEWQYVAPNGIVTVGDTTYIATADGIKVTGDDGKAWAVITDSAGEARRRVASQQHLNALWNLYRAGRWLMPRCHAARRPRAHPPGLRSAKRGETHLVPPPHRAH